MLPLTACGLERLVRLTRDGLSCARRGLEKQTKVVLPIYRPEASDHAACAVDIVTRFILPYHRRANSSPLNAIIRGALPEHGGH